MRWKERKRKHDDAPRYGADGLRRGGKSRKHAKPSREWIEKMYLDPLKTELLIKYGYEDSP